MKVEKTDVSFLTGVETEVGTFGMQQIQIQHFYLQVYDSVLFYNIMPFSDMFGLNSR